MGRRRKGESSKEAEEQRQDNTTPQSGAGQKGKAGEEKRRQRGIDEKRRQGNRNQVSWGILVLGPGRTARRIVFHNRHCAASLVDHKTVRRQTNTTHN